MLLHRLVRIVQHMNLRPARLPGAGDPQDGVLPASLGGKFPLPQGELKSVAVWPDGGLHLHKQRLVKGVIRAAAARAASSESNPQEK